MRSFFLRLYKQSTAPFILLLTIIIKNDRVQEASKTCSLITCGIKQPVVVFYLCEKESKKWLRKAIKIIMKNVTSRFAVYTTILFAVLLGVLKGWGQEVKIQNMDFSVKLIPLIAPIQGSLDYNSFWDNIVSRIITRSKDLPGVVGNGFMPPESWVDGGRIPTIALRIESLRDGAQFSLSQIKFIATNLSKAYPASHSFESYFNMPNDQYNEKTVGYVNGNYIRSGPNTQMVDSLVMFFWPNTFKPNIDFPVYALVKAVTDNPFSMRVGVELREGNGMGQIVGASYLMLHSNINLIKSSSAKIKIIGLTGPVKNQQLNFMVEPNGDDVFKSYVIQMSNKIDAIGWCELVVTGPNRVVSINAREEVLFLRAIPQ